MKLTFNPKQCFSVPEALYSILNTELLKVTPPEEEISALTFNFRDPDFSADDGGFHPVEIRIVQPTSDNNQWSFEYITDFSFQGLPYPELVKDIDVCFITEKVYTGYVGGLNEKAGNELFDLFIENFISYVGIDIFEVKISFD
jgi:hypothetical protein